MAQAKVVNITGKPPRKQHADELLLGLLGVWKMARAELRLSWADFDYRSKFCTNEDAEGCDLGDQFERIRQAENQMVLSQPCTTVGCQHMLEAVVDILQERQRSPDKNLGKGPVIELILNVVRALEQRDVNLTLRGTR